jgi:hypothetical protein
MLKQAATLLALLPLVAPPPRPYDERADARVELTRMLQCARAEHKLLLLLCWYATHESRCGGTRR